MHFDTVKLLDSQWPLIESLADTTPEVDPWCSGPDWVLPAHQAFGPNDETIVVSDLDDPDAPGCLLLTQHEIDDLTLLSALEPMWGFASPVLGSNPPQLISKAIPRLIEQYQWDVLLLPGQPTRYPGPLSAAGSPSLQALELSDSTMAVAMAMASFGHVGVGEGITRQVADLSDGFEPWWHRRSGKFRRNLRKAQSRGRERGLEIVDISNEPLAEVFERLLKLESRSWKGLEGSGIAAAEMATFYRLMVQRLQDRGRFHGHMARLEGNDVGFIIGGIRNRRYRGLQLSYAAEAQSLSVGNLLQHHQIRLLCEKDLVDTYDLGMDFDYKRQWADRSNVSVSLILRR